MIKVHGYVQLSKPVNGERWEHRAVYAGHHGAIPKGMQVHHLNGKRGDNRIENLELVTQTINHRKSDRMGKGYSIVAGTKRPYVAQRNVYGKDYRIGMFGTPCGAYIASRMAYITHG